MKKFWIVSLLGLFFLSIMNITDVKADIYKDARERLHKQDKPGFVKEQISNTYNALPAELPQAVSFPEVTNLLEQYDHKRADTLETVIREIAPLLLSEESIQIQEQAEDSSVDALLSGQVQLETLLSITYARNSSIQAAWEAWQIALERYPQAAYLEGILRQYNSFTKTLNLLMSGMQPQREMIDTQWPFRGVTALRGDIIQNDIQSAQMDYAIVLRDVLTQMKKTFYDYVYIHRAINITRENENLLRQMFDVVSQKFEAGESSYNNVLKVRVVLSKLSDDLITLEDQQKTIAARVNTLMNRAPHAQLGQAANPDLHGVEESLETLYEAAKQNRQEIRKTRYQLERTENMIAMAKEMNRPDPTLGASYFQTRSGLMSGDMKSKGTFKPVPRQPVRPWFGQQEAFIAEMQERRQQLNEKVEQTVYQTLFDVKKAHFSLDAAQREVELYRTSLLPDAEQSLNVAESDYRGARIDFLDYLDAQRTWLDFNLAYFRAQRDQGSSLAELERSVAVSLSN